MGKTLTKIRPGAKGSVFMPRQGVGVVALGIFGFFIGRVIVLYMLNPIAIAYISSFIGSGPLLYFLAACSGLGLATKLKGIYLIKYMLGLLIICSTNFYSVRKSIKPSVVIKAATGAVAVFLAGAVVAVYENLSLYFAITALLEAALTFSVTYLIKKATDVIYTKRKKKLLDTEELISVAILFGGIIAGAADIYVGVISLRLFFVSVVLLITGYKGGSALGATAGTLLGLSLYFLGFGDMSLAIVYSVSGLGAGMAFGKGKIYSAASFLVTGFCCLFFVNRELLSFELLFSVLSAVTMFFFVPDNFYFNINTVMTAASGNTDDYIARIKDITCYRLNNFAATFKNIARTLNGIEEKKRSLTQKDISKLIDDLAVTVCMNCGLNQFCWQNDFYETYQAVFCLLSGCEKKGTVTVADVPPSFFNKCTSIQKFVDTTNKLFELYKINLTWHNKIVESRSLVSGQLMSVATIIKSLSDELSFDVNFKQDLEEGLLTELLKNNEEVDSVIVLENKQGKLEVNISGKICYGKKNCTKALIPIVNKVLGQKMVKDNGECVYKKDKCYLRLVEEQKLRVISGVARANKTGSKESGDSYSFMELKNGQCLIALSDGMGSGKKAKEESVAAVELLEDLIESGFDKEIAVKMINSVLVLKSSEDSFSTLDICAIDLYSGQAEFIKIGAAATFLMRDGVIHTIKSSTLPVGILKDVDIEISSKKLKDGDTIVMVTDGVTEVMGAESNKGEWLAEVISSAGRTNVQSMAERLLEEAEKRSLGVIRDDMTVMVAKVSKR